MSKAKHKELRIVFMGTPEFSIPTLKTLIDETTVVAVYTQPDKPVGRGMKMQASPVKALALVNDIPVYTPEKISLPEEVEKLKAFNADFFVIVAFGQILRPSVIEVPKFGCINVHSSLLPRWRGAAPIHCALLGGDQVTGVTTMMIVQKLDAGDILLQESTPISGEDTSSTIHDRLSEMGAKLILPTLLGLKDQTIKPIPQDESKVTYAHKLTKEMSWLDWSLPTREVDLKVRALNPWPGIKIETESGLSLKIKKGKISAHSPNQTSPGLLTFAHTNDQTLLLHCGDGAYQIEEIQEEGKKAVPVSDFLNGLKGRGISLPLKLKSMPRSSV